MDKCLSHASPTTKTMHVHSLSPCAPEAGGSTDTKPGTCDEDGAECFPEDWSFALSSWNVDQGDHGGFYGIAKDGHVIYGPYNADDELWSCDDVDLCNGFFLADGAYAYATTTFFPYVVGCWGPGPAAPDSGVYLHEHMPSCTSSGCGADAFLGVSFSITVVSALIATYML